MFWFIVIVLFFCSDSNCYFCKTFLRLLYFYLLFFYFLWIFFLIVAIFLIFVTFLITDDFFGAVVNLFLIVVTCFKWCGHFLFFLWLFCLPHYLLLICPYYQIRKHDLGSWLTSKSCLKITAGKRLSLEREISFKILDRFYKASNELDFIW